MPMCIFVCIVVQSPCRNVSIQSFSFPPCLVQNVCTVPNFQRCSMAEWQVFCYGKHRKITGIECKMENSENTFFGDSKTKYLRKSLFLEYFKVKFIMKILRLVLLFFKFNKNFMVYL